MKLLHLKQTPILEQLQIEEALLRLSDEDYCIINQGSSPAIVMGISGKLEELVHLENHAINPIPIIKRFSGGGTVVVDESTLFISFIFQKQTHPFEPYPEPIMRWTAELYKEIFGIDAFALRENDYVIGEKKVGGNAQYLRKNRWLHHTTFLWEFNPQLMQLLLHPKKTPSYRRERSHESFLTTLSEHIPTTQDGILMQLKQVLKERFNMEEIEKQKLLSFLDREHRRTTQLVQIEPILSKA